MMIGFIGAGRVGVTLAKYFIINGHEVSGFYSRNNDSSIWATKFTDTKYYDNLQELVENCDILFITVNDNEIPNVVNKLKFITLDNKLVCHTSGVLSSELFSDLKGSKGFSIHPIFPVNSKTESYKNFNEAFITIESSKEFNSNNELIFFKTMFEKMGNKTAIIESQNKVRYHSAAVFASNLVVGLFNIANDLLVDSGFSKNEAIEALGGLFLNNSNNIVNKGVLMALTGPAERNDSNTILKHLNCLNDDQRLIYCNLTKELIKIAKCKNPNSDYNDILEIVRNV